MPIETYQVQDIKGEINEYFNLKSLYQQHLFETIRKPSLMEYKLGKIRSNYPLRFTEKPGQLIIEIMDSDFSRYLVKKTINIPQKNNVKYTLKAINKTIRQEDLMTDIYNLICKIYHLNLFTTTTKIQQGNGIELTPRQLHSLIEKYNKRLEVLRQKATNLLDTRQTYNEKFRDAKTKGFNSKEILLTKQDIIQSNETTNYLLAINDLVENPETNINYLKYLLNHYELNYYPISGNIEIGSLVLYNKQPCLVLSLINEEQAQIFDGIDSLEVDISELKLLTGINKQLINFHDTSSLLEEDIQPQTAGASESKESEEPDYLITIDNILGKNKLFDKSGVLSYLPKVKTEVGAIKSEEIKKVEIVFPDYTKYPLEKLFNETNTSQLVFGSTMKILPVPGKGYGEYLSRLDLKSGMFNKLATINGWRRILDDSYFMPGNDGNLPYFILGKPFPSVTHFLYYMMFNERSDLNGPKLVQYNQFAERLLYTNENPNSLASMDPDELAIYIASSPFKPSSDWTKKTMNNGKDSLETHYKKIGRYAKFYQYPQLLNALLLTREALLVGFKNKVFTVDFDLMEIRMLLEGKHKYQDYDHDTDKKLLDDFLVDVVRDNLASITDNAHEDVAEGVMDSEVIGNTPFGPPGPVGAIESVASEINEPGIADPILPRNEPIEGSEEKLRNIMVLKEMGLITDEMGEEEIDEALVQYSSLLDEDEAKIYQNLEDFADKYSPRLLIIDVPPNGDCLYYSIVETLNEMNLLPGDFSRKTTKKDVKIGGGEIKEVLTEAMGQLRTKVAKLLQDNIEIAEFEPTKVYIENLPEMTVEMFIEGTSKSADPVDGEGGLWGESIHLGIISGLFNINIVVLDSSEKTMSYLAKDYRPLIKNGELYSDLVEPITIYLGYLVNKHYVGMVPIDDEEHEPKYERLDYWTIMIEYKPEESEPEIIQVALEIEGDSIYPLGYVEDPDKKIVYFQEDNERDDAIYEEVSNQVESIDDPNTDTRLTKLSYWKNIENNEIKLEPTDEAKTLGIVKLNKDNLPVIKFY
jgi:hypothetical protein